MCPTSPMFFYVFNVCIYIFSFSKSTQREHSIITVEKRDIRRSTQNIIALVKPLLFSNLRVGQKKMHSFGGRPRAHSNIIVIYSIVALIKTLGSMFSLVY